MRFWRIVIKDEKNRAYGKTIRGEAENYHEAAIEALVVARSENPNSGNLYIDEVSCYGEKDF